MDAYPFALARHRFFLSWRGCMYSESRRDGNFATLRGVILRLKVYWEIDRV